MLEAQIAWFNDDVEEIDYIMLSMTEEERNYFTTWCYKHGAYDLVEQ